jgi:SAM-dependent methyltransferase
MSARPNTTPVFDDRSAGIPGGVYLPEVFSEVEWQAGSRGNWFWLVDPPGQSLAVELSPGLPTYLEILGSRFEMVRHFDLASPALLPLPITTATVDCVVLHRPWAARAARSGCALLGDCGRVLRPGGCLVLCLDQPLALGTSSIVTLLPRALMAAPGAFFWQRVARASFAASAPWPLRKMERELRAAGFAEVRAYFVVPTIDAPQQLVPAHRDAITVHEAQERAVGLRRLWRRALIGAGLEAMLFQGFLLIALR